MKGQKTVVREEKKDLKMVEIMDVRLFGGDLAEVLNFCVRWIEEKRGGQDGSVAKWIATVNPEFVMKAQSEPGFMKILGKTDLNTIDGVGLVWAIKTESRFGEQNPLVLRTTFPFRKGTTFLRKLVLGVVAGVEIMKGKHREMMAPGADLVVEMSKLAAGKGWKVMLLGGWGDRAKRAAIKLETRLKILDSRFKIESCEGEPSMSNEEVIKKINDFEPDLLFVAYGMGRQEQWIDDNKHKINAKIVMGVGRTFDYLSGDLARAPKIIRKMGFEWLYSLIKEPKRWKRQLVLPKFVWKVLVS